MSRRSANGWRSVLGRPTGEPGTRRETASPFPLADRRPGGLTCGLVDRDHLVVPEGGEPHRLADAALDLESDVPVLGEELPGLLTALSELVALIREPGAALLDDL